MKKGVLIVLEGIDGAGKDTHARLLTTHLRKKGLRVLLTHEPSNGVIGRLAREQLQHKKVSQKWLQLLFAADRQYHVEHEILPALKKGVTVVCDRYFLSSLAYGGVTLKRAWLRSINKNAPKPNLTILLDISVAEALRRVRGEKRSVELFENKQTLQRVRKRYLTLAAKDKQSVVINAAQPKYRVFAMVKKFCGLLL